MHRTILRVIELASCAMVMICLFVHGEPQPEPYPLRLIFVRKHLETDKNVDEVRELVETGARHGYTGIVLSSGLDRMASFSKRRHERLREVKQICDANGMELIPKIFSVGYARSLTERDPNLLVGIPIKNQVFTVEDGLLKHQPCDLGLRK